MNFINSLRSSLDNPPDYPRPELSEEEKTKITKTAHRLAALKDDRLRLAYIIAVCVENATLLKEVNDHRLARGFKPLHSHDNSGEK